MVVAVAHDAVLIDHDHGALGAQAGRERAVGPRDLSAHIGQQRDRERVLRAEPFVRCQVLRGDADHGHTQRSQVLGAVAIGAELFRAHHRVVAGIEEEHHALAAMV